MSHLLVATLGKSPAVVTAMAHALREHRDGPHVEIDRVIVLHPTEADIELGLYLIEAHFRRAGLVVEPRQLACSDTDSFDANVELLRLLNDVLDANRHADIYVSCAGGRKSMSALASVVTQFHRQVRGLYHILDRFDSDPARRLFRTVEELYDSASNDLERFLHPPMDRLMLVDLPYHQLAEPQQLRQYLASATKEAAIETAGEAQRFFDYVLGGATPVTDKLEMLFTAQARDQFRELYQSNRNRADAFWECFRQMRYVDVLRDSNHLHATASIPGHSLHFFKRRRTVERPLYFTEPSPIESNRPVSRVIVAGLSVEQGNGKYDPTLDDWKTYLTEHGVTAPRFRFGDLRQLPAVLIAPVGGSPMIVTQTLTLLQQREGVQIVAIALVYPEYNSAIGTAIRDLSSLLSDSSSDVVTLRGTPPIKVVLVPISKVSDIDSHDTCMACGRAIAAAVEKMRVDHPDHDIYLSVSGGRKTVAAMTYYAAQQANVERVWHTTIADSALEDRVRRDTTSNEIASLSKRACAERYFLHAYKSEIDSFRLFSIPVISVR